VTFRDQLRKLGAETEAKVLAIFTAFTEGSLTYDEAVAGIAAVVVKGNARAVALADLALAANLMTALRRPVATLGLSVDPGESTRLHKAAGTLLALEAVTPERVARLGRAEPLQAGQRAFSKAVGHHPEITGWVRTVSGTACELCRKWAAGGHVYAADMQMFHHPGCSCTQTIVTEEF